MKRAVASIYTVNYLHRIFLQCLQHLPTTYAYTATAHTKGDMAKALSKARDTPVKNNLETSITYLKRPKFQWLTIQRLGTLGGGLNAGIATARFKHDPLDRVFVEKSFKTSDVKERIAHKEIALLKQVGDHMHITRMYDHFIDERARRACLYMEHCDKGSLLDVIMNCGSNQCVNEHNVWDWFIQILSALVYCHLGPRPEVESECLNWATIYHRDISKCVPYKRHGSHRMH